MIINNNNSYNEDNSNYNNNNVVLHFLAGYNKTLEENLRHFTGGKQLPKKVILLNIFTMFEVEDRLFFTNTCVQSPSRLNCSCRLQKCDLSYNLTSTMFSKMMLLPTPGKTASWLKMACCTQFL